MNRKFLAAAVVATFVAVGCSSVNRESGPTGLGAQLAGTWTSFQTGSLQDSCTNFTWTVTQFTGSTGAGTFGATCFGNVQVAGTASATLTTPTTANWSLTAGASGPGIPVPCPLTLSGVATIEADVITIPYTGSWCQGPLSGTERVRR